jgi:AcrR family transcriptional regulator
MGRRPNPQRKQDLLDEIILYLGEHGVGDLSLRPLASRLGTSTYTLTYQFGSKDGLLGDAIRHAESRQLELIESWRTPGHDLTSGEMLRRFWEWCLAGDNIKLVRLLIEATTLGGSQPDVFGDVGSRLVSEWVSVIAEGLERSGMSKAEAERLATHVYATITGLQFDLIATGDTERITRAFDQLCDYLDEQEKHGDGREGVTSSAVES